MSDATPSELEYRHYGIGAVGEWIRVWLHDDALWYSQTRDPFAKPKPVQAHPSPGAWQHFLATVEKLGVWDWQREYKTEHLIDDGAGWSLVLRAGSKAVSSQGENAFPGEPELYSGVPVSWPVYEKFREAIGKLIGTSTEQGDAPDG